MSIPEGWRGRFTSRDPLREPKPRSDFDQLQQQARDAVEQQAAQHNAQRNLIGEALDTLGRHLLDRSTR